MKTILSFAIILFISCNQKSTEQTIKDNIKEYQAKAMNDFSSYQPLEFGDIDSAYTQYFNSKRYKTLSRLLDLALKRGDVSLSYAKTIKGMDNAEYIKAMQESNQIGKEIDSINTLMIREGKAFKCQFSGYKVVHSYRCKNQYGGIELKREYFLFDPAYHVIGTEPIEMDK